ncbi:MAG TPA: hypothetical protein VGN98_13985, partial [Tianweitania sediminis]|nr:hypothetical protein [Tianweitania sediminis]
STSTSTSTSALISELARAANEVERLTKPERAQLMERAAKAIEDLREQFGYVGAPVRNRSGDTVDLLRAMARAPGAYAAGGVTDALLDAAKIIRALARLVEENLGDEEPGNGRTEGGMRESGID